MIRWPLGKRRMRKAFAAIPEDAWPSPDCPPPERLWEALRGELAAEATRELGLHAISCASCSESWRLAKEVAVAARLPAAAARTKGEPAPRQAPWMGWWAVAAATAAVAVVALVLDRGPLPERRGAVSYRAPAEELVQPLIEHETVLPREAFVLRWTGPKDARYDLFVAGDDLTVLDAALALASVEYRVPEAVFAGLPEGTRIVWRVEASLPDGDRVVSKSFVAVLK